MAFSTLKKALEVRLDQPFSLDEYASSARKKNRNVSFPYGKRQKKKSTCFRRWKHGVLSLFPV
ncbi:MAG: hypothetical protein IJW17_01010 [Lentisphaeria bacterium]|nr:hypothetical protein [Lentisphaeria bacterium]